MKKTHPIILSAVIAALAGCTSITGLDAKSSFSCAAPEGVTCQSVSGVYENSIRNNLPAQQPSSRQPASSPGSRGMVEGVGGARYFRAGFTTASPRAGMPLRAPPRVLELWVKAWEDADGDFRSDRYIYMQVDGGRWVPEHTERQAGSVSVPIRVGAPATSTHTQQRPTTTPLAAIPAGMPSSEPGAETFVRPVPPRQVPLPNPPLPDAMPGPNEAAVQEVLQALRSQDRGLEQQD